MREGGRCLQAKRWLSPPASMTSRLASMTCKMASKVFIEGLWFVYVFSGRKLGRYADEELLKSIFQNKTPDLHILIQVHDQQGQQCQ